MSLKYCIKIWGHISHEKEKGTKKMIKFKNNKNAVEITAETKKEAALIHELVHRIAKKSYEGSLTIWGGGYEIRDDGVYYRLSVVDNEKGGCHAYLKNCMLTVGGGAVILTYNVKNPYARKKYSPWIVASKILTKI